jgi:hypothetical protein
MQKEISQAALGCHTMNETCADIFEIVHIGLYFLSYNDSVVTSLTGTTSVNAHKRTVVSKLLR